ncbi:MAG TPA: ABC transporter permease [Geobacteraceae bacterium]
MNKVSSNLENSMRFCCWKFLHMIVIVFAVTALTFLMTDKLPADIAAEIGGQNATVKDLAIIRNQLGLNDSVVVRYVRWASSAVRGDFGYSLYSNEPVIEAIRSHLPVTLELLVLAQLFTLILAIPIGIISAWRADSTLDRALGAAAFGMMSIPSFALAILLMFFFSLRLRWFPAIGYTPMSGGLALNLQGLLMPALSIALVEWVPLMRVLRSDLITTLQEDFILLARSKGLPTWKILIRHALRPSWFTFITLFGLQIGNLIGGAVIIEIIFALPGIGRLLVNSIFAQDFPMVQGCAVLIAVGYVVINFLVDICYGLLDPRIREEGPIG